MIRPTMTKPRILQIGSYAGHPPADAEIASKYDVLQYWKATDPDAFLREHAQDIEVIATSANSATRTSNRLNISV